LQLSQASHPHHHPDSLPSVPLFSQFPFSNFLKSFSLSLFPQFSKQTKIKRRRTSWNWQWRWQRRSTCSTTIPNPAIGSQPISGSFSSSRPTQPGTSPRPSSQPIATSPLPLISRSSSLRRRFSNARFSLSNLLLSFSVFLSLKSPICFMFMDFVIKVSAFT